MGDQLEPLKTITTGQTMELQSGFKHYTTLKLTLSKFKDSTDSLGLFENSEDSEAETRYLVPETPRITEYPLSSVDEGIYAYKSHPNNFLP